MSGLRTVASPARFVVCLVAGAALLATMLGSDRAAARSRPALALRGAHESRPVAPARLNVSLQKLPRAKQVRTARSAAGRQMAFPAAVPESFTQPNPNFNGIGFTGFTPPDPNGDVGPSHYVQMVNSAFQIFNKQGVSLAGPTNINQLWIAAGQNNACSQNNNGDPVVVYDNLADRWLMSQFAVPNGFTNPPTFECIAISQTANPVTGGWFLYQFQFAFAHDYPKIGVWPDGYYMSSQRGFSGGALNAVVFDRAQMLTGNPATFQAFTAAAPALILLPSDLDGPAPPVGTPNFYARAVDGGLWGGADRIDLFAFAVNWGSPALSTFTALPSLPTAASDQNLCAGTNLFDNCVPQPGTATLLETLPHWSMGHLQYRNLGTRETLVFNHTVDADGADHAGIQWFQLQRPPAGAWAIQQQGTHSPDAGVPGLADDPHRWMASIAMDRMGNLALGYSISSSTIFPGIAYTGRQIGDPLGQMPQPETTLINGTASQAATRWGDYSSMTVDPVDGCRFWYTTQYITTGGLWATRIGAFRFSACDLPITAIGTTISATEGTPFSGTVATVIDPDTSATAAEYAATIDWGDSSSPTAGTITGPIGGPFTVTGTHTYTKFGTYTVTVLVTDIDTPSITATAISTANVADAPITASCTDQISSQTYAGVVAAFLDANPFGTASEFTATINWGDGTPATAGTITGPTGGPFIVNGAHTYASTGSFTVTTTINSVGGSTATTSCTFLIGAVTTGGSFVIGDLDATVGKAVTFWGAQWSKRNSLSGGPAPSSFKGFANNPTSNPACGQTWSTDPGNSSGPPPPPLPAFIIARAAGSISKSGSTISGNTPHLVIVQVDPGYSANPGHPGTGTVVGVLC